MSEKIVNCKECVFYVNDGFKDMGFTISTCDLILYIENNKKNGDICLSLLHNEKKQCKYYLNKNNFIKGVIKLYERKKDLC